MNGNVTKACLLSLLQLVQQVASLMAQSQNQDLARILNALPQVPAGLLSGYKVSARETNIVFGQLNSATKSSKQTNVCAYVYRFGVGVVSISCQTFDLSGKLIKERNTFLTRDEVWDYNNSHKEGTDGGSRSDWGSIQSRGSTILSGVPAFLSKSELHDFIKKSPSAIVEIGNSSKGRNCYIVKVATPPKSLVETYKLFLDFNTLTPVEFNSYLSNGTPCSLTELQFEEPGGSPFVFKKAQAKLFSEGLLIMDSSWTSENVERDGIPLKESFETFFPPHTRISDRRFTRPLAYHMGRRLPTSNEIQIMLTITNGVAKYEAASSFGGVPTGDGVTHKQPSWPILTFLACLFLGPLAYWSYSRMKSKQA